MSHTTTPSVRIAFGNKKQTGKDTATAIGMELVPGQIVRFAAPIYEAAAKLQEIAGFPIQKDRDLLRLIGEWARSKDPLVWTNAAMRKVDLAPPETNFWCPDLRLRSEVKALKDRGFSIVKIDGPTRDQVTGVMLPDPDVADLHRTEVELDDWQDPIYSPNGVWWDYLIENHGTREELERKILVLVQEVRR